MPAASRRTSTNVFAHPLEDMLNCNVQLSELKAFDDSMATAFLNFETADGKSVRSWAGGEAVVLSVSYNASPQRGPPRSDVLFKILDNAEDDSDKFADHCRALNTLVDVLGGEKQLAGSTVLKPFTASERGEDGVLFSCRFYENEGKPAYVLRNHAGKRLNFMAVVPGTRIAIQDLTLNNVRLNISSSGDSYTRFAVMPKNMRIVEHAVEADDDTSGAVPGRKRKAPAAKQSIAQLLKRAR